jgi:hypothetical protein
MPDRRLSIRDAKRQLPGFHVGPPQPESTLDMAEGYE